MVMFKHIMAVFICLGLLLSAPVAQAQPDCPMMHQQNKTMDKTMDPAMDMTHCKGMSQENHQQEKNGCDDLLCQIQCKAGISSVSMAPVPQSLTTVYVAGAVYHFSDFALPLQSAAAAPDRPPKALS